MSLSGKVALVTGCSKGIGRSIAELFAQKGAIVYANARQDGCLDDIEGLVRPIYFDVTDADGRNACFKRIMREEKRLDILVNNAGIMKDALVGMIDQTMVTEVFDTNVFAVIHTTQYAARIMERNRCGSIINMTSILGQRGNAGQSVYSASKGAVIALTKALSKEFSHKGIRVNAIAPGMIDTDLSRCIGAAKISENIKRIGMGMMGSPEDIANTALFLASDEAKYITGQIVGVDGGLVL